MEKKISNLTENTGFIKKPFFHELTEAEFIKLLNENNKDVANKIETWEEVSKICLQPSWCGLENAFNVFGLSGCFHLIHKDISSITYCLKCSHFKFNYELQKKQELEEME